AARKSSSFARSLSEHALHGVRDVTRRNAEFLQKLSRFPTMRYFSHRELLNSATSLAQYRSHRITEPAMGIMILDCQDPIASGQRGAHEFFLIQGTDAKQIDHSDRDAFAK